MRAMHLLFIKETIATLARSPRIIISCKKQVRSWERTGVTKGIRYKSWKRRFSRLTLGYRWWPEGVLL